MLSTIQCIDKLKNLLRFPGSHDSDKLADRLNRQAILDEKIKKFLAVRLQIIIQRWLLLFWLHGRLVVHAACAPFYFYFLFLKLWLLRIWNFLTFLVQFVREGYKEHCMIHSRVPIYSTKKSQKNCELIIV